MNFVITMSRQFGTGATDIAHRLADILKIPVYNKAYIEHEIDIQHYQTESETIHELAKSPCIIVGRCASDILKDKRNVINVFVTADKEDRVKRIMKQESLSYEQAKIKVDKTDQERAQNYFEHTGKYWGDVNDYHMILDTSLIPVDKCAQVLMTYFERMEYI